MLKLGIVGWGYWGRNYATYLDTSIDASFTWVCDLRDDMLQDVKKRYPHFHVTKDIHDLITAKLDAVIVATPATYHFRVAVEFLKHNIPLLIEKPMTRTMREAQELVALSHKKNVKVLVGHTFLYNQAIRWLRAKAERKYFGKLYYLEFKRQSYGPIRDDVNIIWDFAPHDLSIATWLCNNQLPQTVYAKAKSYSKNDQEDIANMIFEYPGKVLVNINVAWLYPIKIRTMTLLGKKRMAIFEDTNSIEPVRIYNTTLNYPSETDPYGAAFRLGNISIPRIAPIDPLYTQLKHFVEYLKGTEEPLTPIADGLKNVLLLEALSYSLKKKKEVDFSRFAKRYV